MAERVALLDGLDTDGMRFVVSPEADHAVASRRDWALVAAFADRGGDTLDEHGSIGGLVPDEFRRAQATASGATEGLARIPAPRSEHHPDRPCRPRHPARHRAALGPFDQRLRRPPNPPLPVNTPLQVSLRATCGTRPDHPLTRDGHGDDEPAGGGRCWPPHLAVRSVAHV